MPSVLTTKKIPALVYTQFSSHINYGNKGFFVGRTNEYPNDWTRFNYFLKTPNFERDSTTTQDTVAYTLSIKDGKYYRPRQIGTTDIGIYNSDDILIGQFPIPSGTPSLQFLLLAYFDGDKAIVVSLQKSSVNICFVTGHISTHTSTLKILGAQVRYYNRAVHIHHVTEDGRYITFNLYSTTASQITSSKLYTLYLYDSEKGAFVASVSRSPSLSGYCFGFTIGKYWYYQEVVKGSYTRRNIETGEIVKDFFNPTIEQASNVPSWFKSIGNTILFFANSGVEQEILVTEEYHLNYSFKDNDGNTIRDLTDKLPITKVNFQYVNEDATITLTYLDNSTETVNVTFPSLPNKQLYGLNVVPNAKTPLIVEGDNDFSTQENVTFYPVYKTYIPIGGDLQLDLYQCSAEANRVDKTNYISKIGTLKGAFREETDLLEIDVIIEQKNLPSFNYIYIPILNRWYFVDSIASVRSTLWRLSLSVDVLMTYKDGIRQLKAFVDRNENSSDNTIIDTKRVVQQGYDVETNVVENDLFSKSGIPYSYTVTGFALKDDSQSAQALAVDETKDGEENA